MAEMVAGLTRAEQAPVPVVKGNAAINGPSHYLQATIPARYGDSTTESSSTPQAGTESISTPASGSRTPVDSPSNKLSPYPNVSRTKSALKSTPTSSRLANTQFSGDAIVENPSTGLDGESHSDGLSGPSAPGRKSVQFTRSPQDADNEEPAGSTPVEEERAEQNKPFSLYSKLRALAASQAFAQNRTASTSSMGVRSPDGKLSDGAFTPRTPNESGLSATLEEDSEADADAEESAAEGAFDLATPRKRRRKTQRLDEVETAPSSPHTPHNYFDSNHSPIGKPDLFRRVTDEQMNNRTGTSEDESRIPGPSTTSWTPRHPLRGLSYGNQRKNTDGVTGGRSKNTDGVSGGRRPMLMNLNTISSYKGEASGANGAEGDTPNVSRRRQLAQRGSTLSAAKWKQLKNGLRLLGQSKKKERTQDQKKSAELLAELAAGSPAALMIATMFQRDEHGNKRIPVLLEQLKVNITDSEVVKYKESGNPTPNDRHIIFRIELEYGNGINRMRWTVRRSLADFWSLHSKYKTRMKIESVKGKTTTEDNKKLPRFPREAFPFLKLFGGFKEMLDDDGEEAAVHDTEATDTERPANLRHRSTPSLGLGRRRSSLGSGAEPALQTPGGTLLPIGTTKRDLKYAEKQREELAKYLRRMIHFMLFRPDANRLCKFLEVSALGMRLAAEGSYHGKEGYLVIKSAKGLDFRKALTPTNVTMRHSPKWFLVRHSYIVCVDSPENMNIYDVFLFDPEFKIQPPRLRNLDIKRTAKDFVLTAKESARHPQHHRLKIANSERKLQLLARNDRQLNQFEESIRLMIETSPWAKKNRFDSFAPVRPNCFAQWLVDGRDHMWVVSRALNQAKDVIYIHDWWLSPELYMRRPPAISQKWRLDRLLKRKAEQGVKIFIIVYRNIDAAIPIDSQYTKFSLLDLHPNIFVQRSPNQFRQNTFFWAHHEKICVVDHTLAFVGGIDLCFGRWDTPQHILTDDKPTGFDVSDGPKDSDHCQLWPGKDYSNPRIQDFYALNKPYEEMYDRTVVARMPWHDISMHVVGQPARDLSRHFVQRWNYILRQRKPTRPTPFLLPPPDFNAADLEALGLDGTCEVQILRSAGPWSMGTPDKTEHSIMNAYVKMIEESEHFVYIENQFFISSCVTEGATVFNKIGDALVERIIRAAKNKEEWRATIIIPLIPGFQNTVEQEGGTSVRLIMQYQYRSICRGESSIFGRLKAAGIEPEDYIQFYALRQWGKLGQKQTLVTEQLYIHAKCIIVDDRIALIGSANINERSMLGNRDSECAAVVRDTDMFWSKMNSKPYRVSRFAHTLRMRLMREHLGLDVDKIMEESQALETAHQKHMGKEPERRPQSPDDEAADEVSPLANRGKEIREELLHRAEELKSFNGDVDWEQADNPNLRANRKLTEDHRVTGTEYHKKDVDGDGYDQMAEIEKAGFGVGRDTVVLDHGKEVLTNDIDVGHRATLQSPLHRNAAIRLPTYVMQKEAHDPPLPPMKPTLTRKTTEQLGLIQLSQLPALPDADDTDIGGPPLEKASAREARGATMLNEMKKPMIDRDCMQDPTHESFIDDIWHTIAENNTKIYRAVFRCMPDNQVRDWDDYHQYMAYEQRFNQLQGTDVPKSDKVPNSGGDSPPVSRTGPPGVGTSATVTGHIKGLSKIPSDLAHQTDTLKEKIKGTFEDNNDDQEKENTAEQSTDEKANLKEWAGRLNREQEQRQGKKLTDRRGSLDEKRGLPTVPEHDTAPNSSDGSEATRAASNQSQNGPDRLPFPDLPTQTQTQQTQNSQAPPQVRRKRRGTTRSSRRDFSATDDILSVADSEELLNGIQGHLVEWPYDWLDKVEAGSNWLYPFDQISPIEIYI